jgi:dTDP-4-amino-4,6-dideoxygalactose transaminase
MLSPLSPPNFSGVNQDELMNVLRNCELGKGDEILAHFESDFGTLIRSKNVVALSSATSGLHLALMALGVSEGDIVICPTFTFAASAFPIVYQKAIPYFIDSETETWNMSPQYLENAILKLKANGKKTKAVIIVHSYGNPAKLDELLAICNKNEIPVIEDAANALGSTYRNIQVGTYGTIGVFSFNRNKIISGAGGGGLVTNDKNIADKVRYLAHQAKSKTPYYHHENIGFNYGLSPLLAEIIRQQLPHLTERILDRTILRQQYQNLFNDIAIFQKQLPNTLSNNWLNATLFDSGIHRNEIENLSQVLKVETRRVWKPMHIQPIFDSFNYLGNKESEVFFENGLCLPFSNLIIQNNLIVTETKAL